MCGGMDVWRGMDVWGNGCVAGDGCVGEWMCGGDGIASGYISAGYSLLGYSLVGDIHRIGYGCLEKQFFQPIMQAPKIFFLSNEFCKIQ